MASDSDAVGTDMAKRIGPDAARYRARCYGIRPVPPYKDWNEPLMQLGRSTLRDIVRDVLSEVGLWIPRRPAGDLS